MVARRHVHGFGYHSSHQHLQRSEKTAANVLHRLFVGISLCPAAARSMCTGGGITQYSTLPRHAKKHRFFLAASDTAGHARGSIVRGTVGAMAEWFGTDVVMVGACWEGTMDAPVHLGKPAARRVGNCCLLLSLGRRTPHYLLKHVSKCPRGVVVVYGGSDTPKSVGVHHPNSRGHTKSVGVHHPNSRGHTKSAQLPPPRVLSTALPTYPCPYPCP